MSTTLDLLTTEEVAELLRVDAATIRVWRHRKFGPKYTRVGRRCLYQRADVEKWFSTQTRQTQQS